MPTMPNTRKASRTAISGSQKESICNYARAHPSASNAMILAWARATFRPDFPQSTLSTVLSKNGIITRKSGSRGRPPSRRTLVRLENNELVRLDQQQNEDCIVSSRTGVLVKDLLALAEERCRERSSVYRDVEILLLEEIYNTLRLAQTRLTYESLRERTFELLVQKRPGYQRKYLCQFLDGLAAKYFLVNVVVQYLRPVPSKPSLTYQQMLEKLAIKFPGLMFAPSATTTTTTTFTTNSYTQVPIQSHDDFSPLPTYYSEAISDFTLSDPQQLSVYPGELSNFLISDVNPAVEDLCMLSPNQLLQYYEVKPEYQYYEIKSSYKY